MSLKITATSSSESADFIASFLHTHASGVLVTSNKASKPYGAVVYFSLRSDFSLTFASKTDTQKNYNMAENAFASFVVYDEREQTEVQITGRIEVIIDQEERLAVINYMYGISPKLSMPMVPPADRLLAGDYVAFRLVPDTIKMALYSRPNEERDDVYETMHFMEE